MPFSSGPSMSKELRTNFLNLAAGWHAMAQELETTIEDLAQLEESQNRLRKLGVINRNQTVQLVLTSRSASRIGSILNQRTLPEIVLKVVLSEVPTAVTAVMITTASSAAIRPYSMAVAPWLFLVKASNLRYISSP